jgi:hypothetical protein
MSLCAIAKQENVFRPFSFTCSRYPAISPEMPAHHAVHARAIDKARHEIPASNKVLRKPSTAAQLNRGLVVSAGPQAMTFQRIRDIAMAPTG